MAYALWSGQTCMYWCTVILTTRYWSSGNSFFPFYQSRLPWCPHERWMRSGLISDVSFGPSVLDKLEVLLVITAKWCWLWSALDFGGLWLGKGESCGPPKIEGEMGMCSGRERRGEFKLSRQLNRGQGTLEGGGHVVLTSRAIKQGARKGEGGGGAVVLTLVPCSFNTNHFRWTFQDQQLLHLRQWFPLFRGLALWPVYVS